MRAARTRRRMRSRRRRPGSSSPCRTRPPPMALAGAGAGSAGAAGVVAAPRHGAPAVPRAGRPRPPSPAVPPRCATRERGLCGSFPYLRSSLTTAGGPIICRSATLFVAQFPARSPTFHFFFVPRAPVISCSPRSNPASPSYFLSPYFATPHSLAGLSAGADRGGRPPRRRVRRAHPRAPDGPQGAAAPPGIGGGG